MQVTEKPKTVCVECKWYKEYYLTINHPGPIIHDHKNPFLYSEDKGWDEKRFIFDKCESPQHTVWDTVTGKHTIDPEKKNDGNCKDWEGK